MALKPEHFKYNYRIPMRWSDIDEFHHVNNARYLTYFEESRYRYFQDACQWSWHEDGMILAHVSIDYIKPILLSDIPVCYVACTHLGTKSFTLEYLVLNKKGHGEEVMARGKTVLVGFDYKSEKTIPIAEKYKERLAKFDVAALAAATKSAP